MKQSISKLLVGLMFVLGVILMPVSKVDAVAIAVPFGNSYYDDNKIAPLTVWADIDRGYYTVGETIKLSLGAEFSYCSNDTLSLHVTAAILNSNDQVVTTAKTVVDAKLAKTVSVVFNTATFDVPQPDGSYKLRITIDASDNIIARPTVYHDFNFTVGPVVTPPPQPPTYPDVQCPMPPIDDGSGNILRAGIEDCCVLPGENVHFVMEYVPYFPNSVLPNVSDLNGITSSDPTVHWHVNYESLGNTWDHFMQGNLVADALNPGGYPGNWLGSGDITAPSIPGSYGIKVEFVTSTEGDYPGASENVMTSGLNYTVSENGICDGSTPPVDPTCTAPQTLVNHVCTDPIPPTCTSPQVLVDGICENPTWSYPTSCPTDCGLKSSSQTQTCTGGNGVCSGTASSRTCNATAQCLPGTISVSLSATPTGPLTAPGAINLSWTTTGSPTSCDASGAEWAGTNIINGSAVTKRSGMPTHTYVFGIICHKTGVADATDSVTVVVNSGDGNCSAPLTQDVTVQCDKNAKGEDAISGSVIRSQTKSAYPECAFQPSVWVSDDCKYPDGPGGTLINGVWSEWSGGQTCGTGTETHYCNNPAPANGGQECLLINGSRGLSESRSYTRTPCSCPNNAAKICPSACPNNPVCPTECGVKCPPTQHLISGKCVNNMIIQEQ